MMIFSGALIFSSHPCAAAPERIGPSGQVVPRYVSLKKDPANARAGPGDDNRILWVYHAVGLPVQVVAETAEWRRICDPDHGLAWVHKRTTDGHQAVIRLKPGPATLFAKPKSGAKVTAYLKTRAVAALKRCDDKGWCQVSVEGKSGWVAPGEVWGADKRPQCRAP